MNTEDTCLLDHMLLADIADRGGFWVQEKGYKRLDDLVLRGSLTVDTDRIPFNNEYALTSEGWGQATKPLPFRRLIR